MATWQKFDVTPFDLGKGTYNLLTATLGCALTNVAPDGTELDLTDIAEVTGGGYARAAVTQTWAPDATDPSKAVLSVSAFSFTASGGNYSPFRYLVLFDDTTGIKFLIAYIDYGISYTLTDGNTFSYEASEVLEIA